MSSRRNSINDEACSPIWQHEEDSQLSLNPRYSFEAGRMTKTCWIQLSHRHTLPSRRLAIFWVDRDKKDRCLRLTDSSFELRLERLRLNGVALYPSNARSRISTPTLAQVDESEHPKAGSESSGDLPLQMIPNEELELEVLYRLGPESDDSSTFLPLQSFFTEQSESETEVEQQALTSVMSLESLFNKRLELETEQNSPTSVSSESLFIGQSEPEAGRETTTRIISRENSVVEDQLEHFIRWAPGTLSLRRGQIDREIISPRIASPEHLTLLPAHDDPQPPAPAQALSSPNSSEEHELHQRQPSTATSRTPSVEGSPLGASDQVAESELGVGRRPEIPPNVVPNAPPEQLGHIERQVRVPLGRKIARSISGKQNLKENT